MQIKQNYEHKLSNKDSEFSEEYEQQKMIYVAKINEMERNNNLL